MNKPQHIGVFWRIVKRTPTVALYAFGPPRPESPQLAQVATSGRRSSNQANPGMMPPRGRCLLVDRYSFTIWEHSVYAKV